MILDIDDASESLNHVKDAPSKGKSTRLLSLMKYENANLDGLKESQPILSLGYLIKLKSPIKFHVRTKRISAHSHKAPYCLSSLGPYTPVQARLKPSTTSLINTLTKNCPTLHQFSQRPSYPKPARHPPAV